MDLWGELVLAALGYSCLVCLLISGASSVSRLPGFKVLSAVLFSV